MQHPLSAILVPLLMLSAELDYRGPYMAGVWKQGCCYIVRQYGAVVVVQPTEDLGQWFAEGKIEPDESLVLTWRTRHGGRPGIGVYRRDEYGKWRGFWGWRDECEIQRPLLDIDSQLVTSPPWARCESTRSWRDTVKSTISSSSLRPP